MSPDQLSRNDTESGEQKALFAWAGMARILGFASADNMATYTRANPVAVWGTPVEPLKWLHAIPNGGMRDAATAARMKGEGVRKGIPDVFLPFPIMHNQILKCGLYIELKKIKGGTASVEQLEFEHYCLSVGYAYKLALGWRDAADAIEAYLGYNNGVQK